MRKWIITALMATMLALTTVTAVAAEPVSQEESTPAAPSSVEDMITAIDTKYPKEEDVQAARDAYDTLTKAQKVNVGNYEVLRNAERIVEERNGVHTDDTQKRGTKYSFRISDYVQKVTISVRYMTDSNGDGIMEAPRLTLVSPTGNKYKLPSDTNKVTGLLYDFSVSRTDAGATIDVLKAENGTWTVEADNEVFYTLSDYAEQPSYEEVDPSADVPPTEPKKDDTDKKKTSGSILPLVILALCIGALVFLFTMMKKTPSSKTDKPKKTKSGEKDQKEDDEDENSEEYQEELKRLLADYAKSRGEDFEKKKPEPAAVEEDSRLFESVLVENIPEEDDGISPLSDDGHGSRFK